MIYATYYFDHRPWLFVVTSLVFPRYNQSGCHFNRVIVNDIPLEIHNTNCCNFIRLYLPQELFFPNASIFLLYYLIRVIY
jgi:hypothetical protein